MNTKYLIGENFVAHDFGRLLFSSLTQNFVTFNRRKFSWMVKIRHYQPRKKFQFHKNISFGRNLIGKNSENLTLCSPKHFDMWHARK